MAAPKLYPATIKRTLEFLFEPVESSKNIAGFSLAIVHSIAQAGAAKVEAQHGPAQAPIGIVEDLHGVVHNFVVKIAAEDGMGMADERGKRRIGRSQVQNRLQAAGRTIERDAANCAPGAFAADVHLNLVWGRCGVHATPHFTLRGAKCLQASSDGALHRLRRREGESSGI